MVHESWMADSARAITTEDQQQENLRATKSIDFRREAEKLIIILLGVFVIITLCEYIALFSRLRQKQ